jgi:hypothetical protein
MSRPSLYAAVSLATALLLLGSGCAAPALLPGQPGGFIEPRPVESGEQLISPDEQAFLDSGRAKAIEGETDLWLFYADDNAGVSFRYPHSVSFNDYEAGTPYRLQLRAEPVAGLAEPLLYDEETALANQESLAKGEYGIAVDFSLEASERVRAVGGLNAQDFLVLGRFEVCDVTFERKLYAVNDGWLVVLTLAGDWEDLVADSAEYFQTDRANCGPYKYWQHDQQGMFYLELAEGEGNPLTQEWYELFDQIVDTVEFYPPLDPDAEAGEGAENNSPQPE